MEFENKEVFITGCTSKVNKNGKEYYIFTILGSSGGQTIDCMYDDKVGNGSQLFNKYLAFSKVNPFVKAKCCFKYIGGQYARLQLETVQFVDR